MIVPEQKPQAEIVHSTGYRECQECGNSLDPYDELICEDCDIILTAADDATWD